MASLVAPLVSGISTAPSGSVEIFVAGTSTLADVFGDSEGETQVTTHALDARGGVVRYVKERVDVVVRDADAAEVLAFTWGTDARESRLENLGFSGPDGTGQTVLGGRTTTDAALGLLAASLGTYDGLALVNGVRQTISDALSASASLVFNVKIYGALGDGTTNDSGAVQDALNAASTAGGGIIYFPHGTYLLSTAVVVAASSGKFTYQGESASAVTLKQGTSGIVMLTLGDSNTNVLQGLTFSPSSSANTGTLVAVGTAGRATFLSCAFTAVNGTHVSLAASSSSAMLIDCVVAQAGASSFVGIGNGGQIRVIGGSIVSVGQVTAFDVSPNGNLALVGVDMKIGSGGGAATSLISSLVQSSGFATCVGCRFENLFTSSVAVLGGTSANVFSGCLFVSAAGATLTLGGAGDDVYESASYASSATKVLTGGSTNANARSQLRYSRSTNTSGSATTYTPSGDYAIHTVTSTGASMAFANPSPSVPIGSPLLIIYKNTSGGTITPTFPGTDYLLLAAAGSVDNNKCGVFLFAPKVQSGTPNLICVSPQVAGGSTLL